MDEPNVQSLSERVLNQSRLKNFELFAQVNPVQFRRFFVLVKYNQFRTSIDFASADYAIKQFAQRYALKGRDPQYLYTTKKRSSRLGKMFEVKQQEFLDYIAYEDRETWFNLLDFAATEDIQYLFTEENVGLTYHLGVRIPLNAGVWNAIDAEDPDALSQIYIRLPPEVDQAFGRFFEES